MLVSTDSTSTLKPHFRVKHKGRAACLIRTGDQQVALQLDEGPGMPPVSFADVETWVNNGVLTWFVHRQTAASKENLGAGASCRASAPDAQADNEEADIARQNSWCPQMSS